MVNPKYRWFENHSHPRGWWLGSNDRLFVVDFPPQALDPATKWAAPGWLHGDDMPILSDLLLSFAAWKEPFRHENHQDTLLQNYNPDTVRFSQVSVQNPQNCTCYFYLPKDVVSNQDMPWLPLLTQNHHLVVSKTIPQKRLMHCFSTLDTQHN